MAFLLNLALQNYTTTWDYNISVGSKPVFLRSASLNTTANTTATIRASVDCCLVWTPQHYQRFRSFPMQSRHFLSESSQFDEAMCDLIPGLSGLTP